jgi:hypothetical protein
MKTYTNPSSLGSYFGVGFNTPQEQFGIDLGELEKEFDEQAQDRMLLGNVLEDASLNYFEQKLGIIIDNRNVEKINLYGGKIVGKVDGSCTLNGIPTVVENKISNSDSYRFTDNLGYHIQCQAYMIDNVYQQALLCGLYQGKPIYKIIPRNEEMIKDIKEMVDFVVECLLGFSDFEKDFPHHLYEKYSHKKSLKTLDELDERQNMLIEKLSKLKKQANEFKEIEKEIEEIEDELKSDFEEGIIDRPTFKLILQTQSRSGGLDQDALMLDYPEIDFTRYKKPSSSFKTLRFTFKKMK